MVTIRAIMAHCATLANVQLMTRIYILFTSQMTHSIARLIVYSQELYIRYVFGDVIYSTTHQ